MPEPGYGVGVRRTVSLGEDNVKGSAEVLDGGLAAAIGVEPLAGFISPACALCAESVVSGFDGEAVVFEVEIDKLLCTGLVEVEFLEDRACFIDNGFIEGVSLRGAEIGVSLRGAGGFWGVRFLGGLGGRGEK
jgi:hypothetical protein